MARKSALVTGASSGIGRSAALALARVGYDVAIYPDVDRMTMFAAHE